MMHPICTPFAVAVNESLMKYIHPKDEIGRTWKNLITLVGMCGTICRQRCCYDCINVVTFFSVI